MSGCVTFANPPRIPSPRRSTGSTRPRGSSHYRVLCQELHKCVFKRRITFDTPNRIRWKALTLSCQTHQIVPKSVRYSNDMDLKHPLYASGEGDSRQGNPTGRVLGVTGPRMRHGVKRMRAHHTTALGRRGAWGIRGGFGSCTCRLKALATLFQTAQSSSKPAQYSVLSEPS